MAEFIVTAIADGVATVTLNRPDLHNAFNEVVIKELAEAFTTLGHDDSVRAILLAGEGKSFCAGADLNWMKKMVDYTFDENVQDARALSDMLKVIHDCPRPVIARVHGAAFGGGVGLIAACDIAVATEAASFSLSEVKLGLLPAVISPFVVRKIGMSASRRYCLTAERFKAAEALRIGLVTEVVSDVVSLDEAVTRITDAIKANGPQAVAICKTLLEKVELFDWGHAVDISTKMIAERRASTEGQEGMKAFLEKRPASWMADAAPAGKG